MEPKLAVPCKCSGFNTYAADLVCCMNKHQIMHLFG